MEILDNTTMPDFYTFTQKVLVLLFKVQNFKLNADKSECLKVKSCLELMRTKFHGPMAPASWSGSELFSLLS